MTDKYFVNTSDTENRMEFLTPSGKCVATRDSGLSGVWLVCIESAPNHTKDMQTIMADPTPVGVYEGWLQVWAKDENEPIDHPTHYNSHASGVEAITICRHMNFNIGNAFKYLFRESKKGGIEDLKKAAWYIADEIKRVEK